MSLVAFALASGSARADDSGQVLISYEAAVGARKISGVSHSLQWRVVAQTADSSQVRLLVPLGSFESGHAEFDALLRAAARAERHPFVEVEGVAGKEGFEGTITLRGVSRPLKTGLELARVEGRTFASVSFSILLSEFGISVPSVGDKLAIDFVARLPGQERAVISGGAVSWSN